MTLTSSKTKFAVFAWTEAPHSASRTSETPPQARNLKVPEVDGKLPRLAFSVKKTAGILGTSQKTVYRLTCRGLLYFSDNYLSGLFIRLSP